MEKCQIITLVALFSPSDQKLGYFIYSARTYPGDDQH